MSTVKRVYLASGVPRLVPVTAGVYDFALWTPAAGGILTIAGWIAVSYSVPTAGGMWWRLRSVPIAGTVLSLGWEDVLLSQPAVLALLPAKQR